MNWLEHIGKYTLLMKGTFARPDKHKMFLKRLGEEMYNIGVSSMGIVSIISVFIGAVIAIQTSNNMDNPMLPSSTVGFITRDTILLEFSSTMICLILAGKVGAHITSEIGTMRVTEQIDALEMMGVNSANYLILPKIIAMVLTIPFLVGFSMFLGILGGYFGGVYMAESVTPYEYVYGLQSYLRINYVWYSLLKSLVFAFIITSVSAYFGYYTKGGAVDVGNASTRAVVRVSILVLFFNVIITQLFFG